MRAKALPRREDFSISYCSVLVLLFLYFSQQLIPAGDMVGLASLSILMAGGVYSWLQSFFNRRRPAPITAMSWFYLFFVAVWIVSSKSVFSLEMGRVPTFTLFKNTSMFCLMLFWGYKMGLSGRMSDRQNMVACIVVTLTAVLQFVIVGNSIIEEGKLGQDFTNNGGYCMVTALSFITPVIRKHRVMSMICFVILFTGVMMSVKRGAILCMTVMLIYYYLYYPDREGDSKRRRVFLLVFITVGILGTLLVEAVHTRYLQSRVMETLAGGMSGRDHIYRDCIEAWTREEDFVILLSGRGISSTIGIAGNYAHSDWLELLTDMGLTGVILYAVFFITAFRFVNSRRRYDPYMRFTMNLILLLTLCQSIFSMGFAAIFNCWSALLWGIYAGNMTVRPHPGASRLRRDVPFHTPPPVSCRGRDC